MRAQGGGSACHGESVASLAANTGPAPLCGYVRTVGGTGRYSLRSAHSGSAHVNVVCLDLLYAPAGAWPGRLKPLALQGSFEKHRHFRGARS